MKSGSYLLSGGYQAMRLHLRPFCPPSSLFVGGGSPPLRPHTLGRPPPCAVRLMSRSRGRLAGYRCCPHWSFHLSFFLGVSSGVSLKLTERHSGEVGGGWQRFTLTHWTDVGSSKHTARSSFYSISDTFILGPT